VKRDLLRQWSKVAAVGVLFLLCHSLDTGRRVIAASDITSPVGCIAYTGGYCDVIAYSLILDSTDHSEIYTESVAEATIFGPCDGVVEVDMTGELYNDTTDQRLDQESNEGGLQTAVETKGPMVLGDFYETDSNDISWYEFCDYQDESGDCIDYEDDPVPGSTSWGPFGFEAPEVTSMTPTSANVGSQTVTGQITFEGQGLIDPFTNSIQLSPASDSGLTLTLESVSQNGTEVIVQYSITPQATVGPRTITLSTALGSVEESFGIGDPPPTISSVTPDVWQAGSQYSVSISGSGFGTNPQVSVSGAGVALISDQPISDGLIDAVVAVGASAPTQLATISVQSDGYGGGFYCATSCSGQPVSTYDVQVQGSAPPPAPTIVYGLNTQGGAGICNGTDVTSEQIYVGQQVAFSGCVPSSELSSVTSESWSWSGTAPTQGVAIAGFSVGPPSPPAPLPGYAETITNVPSTNPCGTAQNCDYAPFYWVTPSTYTVTFQYTIGGSGSPGSTTLTFTVQGPSVNGASATPGTIQLLPPGTVINHRPTTSPWLNFGNPNDVPGMEFTAPSDPTNGQKWSLIGQYSWVQIVNSITVNIVATPPQSAAPFVPGLDNTYPYGGTNSTNDSPGIALDTSQNELAETFSATMYLLWTPPGPSGCSGSECTVPVPLGSIAWGFNGDAVNQQQLDVTNADQTWVVSCGQPLPAEPTFQQGNSSNSYPTWTAVAKNVPQN
jgi:hypothetical protein